jgi:hypothetical protein
VAKEREEAEIQEVEDNIVFSQLSFSFIVLARLDIYFDYLV